MPVVSEYLGKYAEQERLTNPTSYNMHNPEILASLERCAVTMRDCYESMSPEAKAASLELAHAMSDLKMRLLDREPENVIRLARELEQGQGLLPGIRL